MNEAIFREYDIRGLADTELTDEVARGVGRAVATRLKREGARSLCLARDIRASSPRLSAALTEGVLAAGLDAVDVGIVATPVFYYAILRTGADGGVTVTGSHNPIEYNGFKICRGTSPVWGEEIRAIGRQMREGDFENGRGKRREQAILADYKAMVLERVPRGRRLKIVVDAGNGTGGEIGPEVLEGLGHEVVRLYCDLDGRFPNHLPDPTVPKYMRDLQARVVAEKADLGVGYDGDADRIGLVDETGRLLFGDQILALFAVDLLARLPGSAILYDVKCSQALEDVVRAAGGIPVMWKTGHSLLKAKMREDRIPLAGEMSGHMFFAEGYFGFDDAIYGSARMAGILSGSADTLAARVDRMPVYQNSPEIRVACPDDAKFRVVEELARHFQRDHRVITIDGARVVFPDGWGLVRASNTQPVLVLRFESRTREGLAAIEAAFREALLSHPEVEWKS
jgi:phosphomannomutase / phosphoglucomutase